MAVGFQHHRLVLGLASFVLITELFWPCSFNRVQLSLPSEVDVAQFPRDNSGDYVVHRHVARATAAAAVNATLATHMTPQHVLESVAAMQRWEGYGSAAIFITSEDGFNVALDMLSLVHACYPRVFAVTDYHFVYLSDMHASKLSWKASATPRNGCSNDITPKQAEPRANYAHAVPYPNNMLRNVAVSGARTDIVAVLDADMVPSQGLARTAVNMLEAAGLQDQIALVAPAFETREHAPVPQDKVRLLDMLDRGDAEPFYIQLCAKCQNTTDFKRWTATAPGMRDAYEVAWKDPWEPLYVSRRSVTPPYDERFKQYGFNRISQVCELHIAGFQFHVLTDEFVVHPGFKIPQQSFHASKEEEQAANRLLFRKFKQELKKKYPGVARRCY